MHLTYRYRVRDKHAAKLNAMARAVNTVWNYCNEAQLHALKWGKQWPTAYDLHKLTAGTSKGLGISATAVNAVCTQYVRSRTQHKKSRLRFRGVKSLGWVPLKADDVIATADGFRVMGRAMTVWMSRTVPPAASICDGSSLAQDAQGHWYLNVAFHVEGPGVREPERRVGIDLGLKDFATLSTGEKITAPQIFRQHEAALAQAKRARKRGVARRIHAKIGACRSDFLHKLSTKIVKDYDFIAVGDVSSSRLAKTRMAKSVLDAGWSSFRKMLAYKAIAHGSLFAEVAERYSTQACSDCGVVSGPKGRKGLVIRDWTCEHCGAVHDRDTNAARIILRRGLATLLEEPARQIAA